MKLIDIKIQALLKLWWIACCFIIFRQKSREFLDAAFMHSADVFHPTFFEEFFSTSATTVKHSKWDYFSNNLLSLEREKKNPRFTTPFFLGLWSSQILTYFSTYGNRLKIWHHGYFFPLMTTPRKLLKEAEQNSNQFLNL